MGKHKKTRQEKIVADLRRKLFLQIQTSSNLINKQSTSVSNFKLKFSNIPSNASSSNTSLIYTHEYLKFDILKTAFLTSSIVIAEVILFLLSKQQIIKLP